MAYQQFIEWRPQTKTLILLKQALSILDEFIAAGYVVTLRQLFYQLVARDIVPNSQNEYDRICAMMTNARKAGMADWDAIEDRARVPNVPLEFDCFKDLMQAAYNSYRLNRWASQPVRVELWSEKDALSSILWPITKDHHISLVINRGYPSVTALYSAYQRFQQTIHERQPIILYLGDHDPSGLDMIRAIREQMDEFTEPEGWRVHIKHIGLTAAQIKRYSPPPNPAKTKDPRYKWYTKKYGDESWEVDALRPDVLNKIVTEAIEREVEHPERIETVKKIETEDIKRLRRSVNRFMKKADEGGLESARKRGEWKW